MQMSCTPPTKDPSVTLFFGRTSLSNRNIVLAILLLAGDIHPNLGSINRETIYPCGYCQQHVGWYCSGVGCETCNVWYHRECVSITHSYYTSIWLLIIRLMFGFFQVPDPRLARASLEMW